MVQNLVINADQAMPAGGEIRVDASNQKLGKDQVGDLPPGPYVKIRIADQGPGIPREHMAKIFEPFFSTKQNGSGLGLSIAFSIVKSHGGLLAVDQDFKSGLALDIWLPAQASVPGKASTQPREAQYQGGSMRLLLMDDEQSIRKSASMMLRIKGHTVDAVRDGEEALRVYRRTMEQGEAYDLVILDLTIKGGMGGKEAMEELLAIDPCARVIVSSGYSEHPVMAMPKQYGFRGSVPKPYTAAALDAAIQGALFDS